MRPAPGARPPALRSLAGAGPGGAGLERWVWRGCGVLWSQGGPCPVPLWLQSSYLWYLLPWCCGSNGSHTFLSHPNPLERSLYCVGAASRFPFASLGEEHNLFRSEASCFRTKGHGQRGVLPSLGEGLVSIILLQTWSLTVQPCTYCHPGNHPHSEFGELGGLGSCLCKGSGLISKIRAPVLQRRD